MIEIESCYQLEPIFLSIETNAPTLLVLDINTIHLSLREWCEHDAVLLIGITVCHSPYLFNQEGCYVVFITLGSCFFFSQQN